MEANKDKGTIVGFSNTKFILDDEFGNFKEVPNTVCKEHEWANITLTTSGMVEVISTICRNCGIEKPPIDFKIKENVEIINKTEWEDIWNEYNKIEGYRHTAIFFKKWLQENYTAPEKK